MSTPRIPHQVLLITLGAAFGVTVVGGMAIRAQLERRYRSAIVARRQLELQLGELRADRERIGHALDTERERVESLSKELADRNQELERTVARLTQEQRTMETLERKLAAVQHQFDLVQGELALALQHRGVDAASPTPSMVQLEKVVVTGAPSGASALEGHVISVHSEWKFIVTDLGWDTVNIGDVISIYRNNQLLGKARIERVQEEASAATLLPEWEDSGVEVNDVVRAL